MSIAHIKLLLAALSAILLLLTACSKHDDSDTVAQDFVRLYFVEDSLSEAAKLASGSARAKLEESLQEAEAIHAKEPAGEKPRVKATMLETQPVSRDEVLYIYRVVSGIELSGMEPITAKLWLSRKGDAWRVSKFAQDE